MNTDQPSTRRAAAGVLIVAALGLGTYVVLSKLGGGIGAAGSPVVSLDPARVVVLRTPGGLLEVSTLVRVEEFGWQQKFDCFFVDCRLFKPTITRVRVPVHYTYRVPLSETWELRRDKGVYVLTVPAPQPKLPPAIETAKAEFSTEKQGWISPPAAPVQEAMMKQLGPELDRRAAQRIYFDQQRPQAEKTVREFAEKWMKEQLSGPNSP